MVLVRQAPRRFFDVSFMVTRQCDLECPFCMYDSSPRIHDRLDPSLARSFIASLALERINSFGFYGGEPAVALKEFGEVALMLPKGAPRFVITNGAWSKGKAKTEEFLGWALLHQMHVYVSSTAYHQRFQDRERLEELAEEHDWVTLKPGERKGDFIPMGKLAHLKVNCTQMCVKHERPTRLAVQPDGSVLFQNCDGRYPIVGQAEEGFRVLRERVETMYEKGFMSVCPFFKPEAFAQGMAS